MTTHDNWQPGDKALCLESRLSERLLKKGSLYCVKSVRKYGGKVCWITLVGIERGFGLIAWTVERFAHVPVSGKVKAG